MNIIIYYLLYSLACYFAGVNSLNVEPFDSINFAGLMIPRGNPNECNNFSDYNNFLQETRSLKTDGCIMLFKEADCQSYSIRLDPGEYPNLGIVKHDSINFMGAKSFRACGIHHQGLARVYVDIHGTAMIIGDDNPPYQGLLHWYRDICDCLNLPTKGSYVGTITSVFNHGNCIKLYEQRDCQGTSLELLGGVSPESSSIPSQYSFLIPSASIGLCEPRPNCHLLDIVVQKFVLTSRDTEAAVRNRAVNITFGTKTLLGNNAASSVMEIYEDSGSIEEIVEITRIPSFGYQSNNFSTSNFLSYELLGSWFWNPENVKEGVAKAYQTSVDASKNGDKFISKEEINITVRQHIELQPCSEHAVELEVTMAQYVLVEYDFYATVTGGSNVGSLTAAELEERLTDGLVYVQDIDNSTIMVRGFGMIYVDLSLDAKAVDQVRQLEGCTR